MQFAHLHRRTVTLDIGLELHRLRRNAQHQGAEHPVVPFHQIGLYPSGVGRGELTVGILDDLVIDAVGELGIESRQVEHAGVHVAPPLAETMSGDPKFLCVYHLRASSS